MRIFSFIDVALAVCIVGCLLILLYIHLLAPTLFKDSYVPAYVVSLYVYYPTFTLGLVGSSFGAVAIVHAAYRLIRHKSVPVVRYFMIIILFATLWLSGAWSAVPLVYQQVTGQAIPGKDSTVGVAQSDATVAGGSTEKAVDKPSATNDGYDTYKEVKAQIDACNVNFVIIDTDTSHIQLDSTSPQDLDAFAEALKDARNDEKYNSLDVHLSDEVDSSKTSYGWTRNYKLPLTYYNQILKDMKKYKADCPPQKFGPSMDMWPQSEEVNEYGSPLKVDAL